MSGEKPARLNLTSPSQVKAWCIATGFHPNRTLGQNFLIDRNALMQIVDAANGGGGEPWPAGTRVLEVGPGLGVLTEEMLARGWAVTAIEKDPPLATRLKEALGNPPALTVCEGDALAYVARGACDGFPLMISNLPYQAGTRILLELIGRLDSAISGTAPEVLVALVQTEVAERLAAAPGSKVRGLAGVWAQLDYDVTCVRKVGANCFWPRPEIGSTVVRLKRHHNNDDLSGETRATFRRITKIAFEHRRKQLGSIFRGIVRGTARAEELALEEWLELAANWPQEESRAAG